MIVIILGSPLDYEFANKTITYIVSLNIKYELFYASAHKSTEYLLGRLKQYEKLDIPIVYITVAGRSNALSGVVDANVKAPVIACPPLTSDTLHIDIFSSLRMPIGVAPAVILDPVNAALFAAKVLGKTTEVAKFQASQLERITEANG